MTQRLSRLLPIPLRWAWTDESRRLAVRLLAVCGCVMMILSAWYLRAESPDEWLGVAGWWMIGGGLAMGAALLVARRVEGTLLPLPVLARRDTAARMNWILTGVGVVLLAALVVINVTGHPVSRFTQVSHHVQFALFVGGVGLFGLGLGGFLKPHTSRDPSPLTPSPNSGSGGKTAAWFGWIADRTGQIQAGWRREVMILLAVLVVAAVPRLIGLGQTTRFEVDELQAVVAVNAIEATPNIPILNTIKPLHWNWAWLFPYVQTWIVEAVGHTWAGLRLIGALCGLAGVGALYALARAWFDRETAVVAALLLAALPAHIHYSRLSLINITDLVFGVLALASLSWGLRTNRRAYFVAGGVMLGLTQYFYEGGRLLFPALTLVWLAGLVLLWRKSVSWRKVALMLVTAVIVAAPFYIMMAAVGRPFGERVNDHYGTWDLLFGPMDVLVNNLIQPFLLLVHYSDFSIGYIYYGGQQPVLLPYVVVVFLLGIVYAGWRGWQPGMMLVALWLGMGLVGFALTVNDGVNVRLTSLFPTFPLLAALGIRQTLALLWPKDNRWQVVVLTAVTALLCIGQIHHYFAVYLPEYEIAFRAERPGRDLDDAVERAAGLPAGTHVYIVTDWDMVDQYYVDQVMWMSAFMIDDPNVRLMARGDLTPDFVSRLAPEANRAFFVSSDNREAIELLQVTFPTISEGQPSPYGDIPAWEQFMLYYVEGADSR